MHRLRQHGEVHQRPSPRDATFNLALKTVENIGLEAARSPTPSEEEELHKWHKTYQSENP
tara:strand:- start:492 stop:671 length:180 start_codon:yes stop_codon:yes gene_type:complete